eukprot:2388146-Pleurochrysis_carterae.AAC.1
MTACGNQTSLYCAPRTCLGPAAPPNDLHIYNGTAAQRSYEVAVGRWIASTVPRTPELACSYKSDSLLRGSYQSDHPGGKERRTI